MSTLGRDDTFPPLPKQARETRSKRAWLLPLEAAALAVAVRIRAMRPLPDKIKQDRDEPRHPTQLH